MVKWLESVIKFPQLKRFILLPLEIYFSFTHEQVTYVLAALHFPSDVSQILFVRL
jgi:hypothetical protein